MVMFLLAVSIKKNYHFILNLYTIRMLAYHAGGNGISSEYIDVKTLEGGKITKEARPRDPQFVWTWNSPKIAKKVPWNKSIKVLEY